MAPGRDLPDRILAGLTNHVQAKLEPLAQILAAALDPLAPINPVESGRVPPRDVDRDFGPSRWESGAHHRPLPARYSAQSSISSRRRSNRSDRA